MPDKDDDYLAKVINLLGTISDYAKQNKKQIAKCIAIATVSAYSFDSLYNSGGTFSNEPHYSLFIPSTKYFKSVFKKLKKKYDLKKINISTFNEEYNVFQKYLFNKANEDKTYADIVQMLEINLFNFVNYLPDKTKNRQLYHFSGEYTNFKDIFKKVKVLQKENVIIFHGKLNVHFWIHLPLKYEISKTDGDKYTMIFIPLHKRYSTYAIVIEIKKERNNILFETKIKGLKNSDDNSFSADVMKNIAAYLTYDIVQGMQNNMNVLYKRKMHFNKMSFVNSTNKNVKRNKSKHSFFPLKPVNSTVVKLRKYK